MALNSISSLTKLRLTGLSSGMDTDAIIKSMMQIEQLKINRQLRAKTTLQWKQDALGGVKNDLKAFKDEFISVLGKKTMMTEAAYNTFKAEVTGKKASAVTITASPNASTGKTTVDSITSLAKGASLSSAYKVSAQSKNVLFTKEQFEDPNNNIWSQKLGDLFGSEMGFTESGTAADGSKTYNGEIAFYVNGEEFRFSGNDTLINFTTSINTAKVSGFGAETPLGVKASFVKVQTGQGENDYGYSLKLETTEPGKNLVVVNGSGYAFGDVNSPFESSVFGMEGTYRPQTGVSQYGGLGTNPGQKMLRNLNLANKLEFEYPPGRNGEIGYGQLSFRINGEQFNFKDTDTLQTMMNTINSSNAGVEMKYSELTDSFTLSTKETGLGTSLSIQNVLGNAFGDDSAFGFADGTVHNGKNAVLSINGTEVTRNSNEFTIDGIRYLLNKEAAPDADDPIEITISRDVQPAFDKIKEFIDGYNTMIVKLQTMLTEKKSRDESQYVPLTEDEKAEMTEKQIEQWEAIAKKGILKSDSGIQSLLGRLRGALYETVTSAGLSPADIGLKTGDYKAGEIGGLIDLNDENSQKLKTALEKDPAGVMRLFADISDADDRSTEYKESGLIMRMSMIFDDYTKGSNEIALEGLERSLLQVNDKISSMQQRMLDKEEKLYKQYAAMETALSKIQSQSDWLSGVLGSMNK